MPRTCTVCTHPRRDAIDRQLIAQKPFRYVAEQTGLSITALHRHREAHLPATLVKARENADVRHAIDVVDQLRAINQAAVAILIEARKASDADTALKAIDRIQKQIELQAKLIGDLDEGVTVNVLISPEWQELRGRILTALEAHPAARIAVAAALVEGEADAGG
jgi:hypothetical protein